MIERILIIKMWAMGDVVMATPMLAALRQGNPTIHIAWLIDSRNVDLIQGHPQIDEVISVDTAAWRKQLKNGQLALWIRAANAFRSKIRDGEFDAVINCHPDKWWTLIFCAAMRRVALYPFAAPSSARLFYTDCISRPQDPPVHNTIHYLLATRTLGFADSKQDLSVAPIDEPGAKDQSTTPTIVIAPFSTADNRNWPQEQYVSLIQWLITSFSAHVVVTGAPNERNKLREMVATLHENHATLADHLTVSQFVEIIRSADLVISGDSSPMHIAAATGVPYVALFGATPVGERAPLVGTGRVIHKELYCAPCDRTDCSNPEYRKCMKLIELIDVQAAVTELLRVA
jgi:heptosyltransferase I